jgi:hypothetical protein
MIPRDLLRGGLLAAILLAPSVGWTATIQFCLKLPGAYDDNNFSEDYWTDDAGKLARGAAVTISRVGEVTYQNPVFNGYLGDGLTTGTLGCTTSFNVSARNGTYYIWIGSYGYVNNNWVYAKDRTSRATVTAFVSKGVSDGQAVQNVTITPAGTDWNVFNVYSAAAYALYRHDGGLTESYDLM